MSGSRPEVPPEVPGEFADAYLAAYEAALREADEAAAAVPVAPPARTPRRRPAPRPGPGGDRPERSARVPPTPQPATPEPSAERPTEATGRPVLEPEPTIGPTQDEQAEPDEYDEEPESPLAILRRPAARPENGPEDGPETEPSGRLARWQDSGYLVPVLLVLLVLVLVLGAYGVGRVFAGHVDRAGGGGSGVMTRENGKRVHQATSQQKAGRGAWDGKVVPLRDLDASAACTSAQGVDAAGATVTYTAQHLVDRVADTTWRCDGKAIGQVLTFDLGGERSIGEVGLIPGYAKTDDADGTDRYAENNRVTKVRWRIGTRVVVQTMSGGAKDRSLRLLRVPRTSAREVTLQIVSVDPGARDTTAISEVVIARTG